MRVVFLEKTPPMSTFLSQNKHSDVPISQKIKNWESTLEKALWSSFFMRYLSMVTPATTYSMR